jgi:hypothetical protein
MFAEPGILSSNMKIPYLNFIVLKIPPKTLLAMMLKFGVENDHKTAINLL